MEGRTALVTGASRGIGAAIADRLRQGGARVLTPSRGDLDLSSDASTDDYLTRLVEPVDILINNAGINIAAGVLDVVDRNIRDTIQTNLVAPLHLIRGLAFGMAERRYGRILNISSIWSVVSRRQRLTYTVSKSALDGLTRAIAVELAAFGILVNSIAPGYVDTEMTRRNNTPEEMNDIRAKIPLGRLADPPDIAEVAAFLCSAKNAYITGQTIIVDGGYTCL